MDPIGYVQAHQEAAKRMYKYKGARSRRRWHRRHEAIMVAYLWRQAAGLEGLPESVSERPGPARWT